MQAARFSHTLRLAHKIEKYMSGAAWVRKKLLNPGRGGDLNRPPRAPLYWWPRQAARPWKLEEKFRKPVGNLRKLSEHCQKLPEALDEKCDENFKLPEVSRNFQKFPGSFRKLPETSWKPLDISGNFWKLKVFIKLFIKRVW